MTNPGVAAAAAQRLAAGLATRIGSVDRSADEPPITSSISAHLRDALCAAYGAWA